MFNFHKSKLEKDYGENVIVYPQDKCIDSNSENEATTFCTWSGGCPTVFLESDYYLIVRMGDGWGGGYEKEEIGWIKHNELMASLKPYLTNVNEEICHGIKYIDANNATKYFETFKRLKLLPTDTLTRIKSEDLIDLI